MFKRLLILLIILLESGIFYAGNPVMIVRCGRPRLGVSDAVATGCEGLGNFVSYKGHCYALPEDGSCPNYPESLVLVPMDVDIDGATVSICVPDCSNTCESLDCESQVIWDGYYNTCLCEEEEPESEVSKADVSVACDECPFFLDFESGPPGVAESGSETGCLAPLTECYELGIAYTIEPFVCDGPEAANDTIKIVIKGAGGAPLPEGSALTISALQNCNLLDGTQNLTELSVLFGENAEAAFVADDEGCIILEFTRNPSQATTIELLSADTTITIPACPRAFDPCSCTNPNNVTSADGTVQFWYDEMTVIGSVATPVILTSNNIPAGFLTLSQTPFINNTDLGNIEPIGTLTVPFLRTPGSLTNVELSQTVNGILSTTTLMSSCTLSTNSCTTNTIPTIGEWGLIVLGLSLLIIGVATYSRSAMNLS